MARLPVPNSDDGVWGSVLNDYLLASHNADGTLKSAAVSADTLNTGTGSNGQVLTKNSGTTGGLQWTTPSAGGVTSVNTRTGAVTLSSSDVGLANVNNTSDANKPISTATQTALNGKANTSHTHTISQVTTLDTELTARQTIVRWSGTA